MQVVVTADEARSIAERHIGSLPDDRVLVERDVPSGWAFHVQSREYVETNNFSSQLVGGLIYLVLRTNGSVHEFPSHPRGYQEYCAAAGLPTPT